MPEVAASARAFTDSHAHLSYVAERSGAAALERVLSLYRGGDETILDPGVEADDFPARKALLSGESGVRLAAGVWPDGPSLKAIEAAVALLETHVSDPACVAVGECGLDFHWMNGNEAEQESLFRAQAELALRYAKPLIVHSREAGPATLRVVRDYASRLPVLIHCFGYGEAEAREFLALGCWISFAGNLTYARSSGLRSACAAVPDDRLLIETDAPYMNPEPLRGKPSSPEDIGRTYALAASLRSCDVDSLARTVRNNARTLFG